MLCVTFAFIKIEAQSDGELMFHDQMRQVREKHKFGEIYGSTTFCGIGLCVLLCDTVNSFKWI